MTKCDVVVLSQPFSVRSIPDRPKEHARDLCTQWPHLSVHSTWPCWRACAWLFYSMNTVHSTQYQTVLKSMCVTLELNEPISLYCIWPCGGACALLLYSMNLFFCTHHLTVRMRVTFVLNEPICLYTAPDCVWRQWRAWQKSVKFCTQWTHVSVHCVQHLTVLESMRVAADLKLGERMPRSEKELVISEILDTLGLNE